MPCALFLSFSPAPCSPVAPPSNRPRPAAPKSQAEFEKLTAGKVPGQPMTCLPSYRAGNMVPIDDSTVASRTAAAST